MNEFLSRVVFDPLAQLTARQVLDVGLQNFYFFVLVLVRMSGLMTIGPVFGQSLVPPNIRVLLVLSLSILITPALPERTELAFRQFDANRDGLLQREELPQHLAERFDRLVATAGTTDRSALAAGEFFYALELPSTIVDFAWIGAGEFALGLVLGLGVLIVLSGLQLAGEIIDQQTGIALGEVANPGLEINGSITGQFLFLFGTAVLLLMEPLGGHLLMVGALIETFQTLPVGDSFVSVSAVELLRDLVHQSLIIGVQVAAPLVATMSLVALTIGFLGHTVPQINVLVIGFPIRALTSLLVLALSMSGTAGIIIDSVPVAIDSLRDALMGL